MHGNAFIAHGGGPTAVLNASLLGVVEAARRGAARRGAAACASCGRRSAAWADT
jgi:hypothetical protein